MAKTYEEQLARIRAELAVAEGALERARAECAPAIVTAQATYSAIDAQLHAALDEHDARRAALAHERTLRVEGWQPKNGMTHTIHPALLDALAVHASGLTMSELAAFAPMALHRASVDLLQEAARAVIKKIEEEDGALAQTRAEIRALSSKVHDARTVLRAAERPVTEAMTAVYLLRHGAGLIERRRNTKKGTKKGTKTGDDAFLPGRRKLDAIIDGKQRFEWPPKGETWRCSTL